MHVSPGGHNCRPGHGLGRVAGEDMSEWLIMLNHARERCRNAHRRCIKNPLEIRVVREGLLDHLDGARDVGLC